MLCIGTELQRANQHATYMPVCGVRSNVKHAIQASMGAKVGPGGFLGLYRSIYFGAARPSSDWLQQRAQHICKVRLVASPTTNTAVALRAGVRNLMPHRQPDSRRSRSQWCLSILIQSLAGRPVPHLFLVIDLGPHEGTTNSTNSML